MKTPRLAPRLAQAVGFVRKDAFVVDVGTDHAYLPIYLCLSGKTEIAMASDINDGPVRRAAANVRAYGLCDRITTVRADGIPNAEYSGATDIIIFGMGGELIADITARMPEVLRERSDVRFILQPMTRPEILRSYLYGDGFTVSDESLIKESNGKIYQIICASYTGKCETHGRAELLVGALNTARGGDVFREYAARQADIIQAVIRGREISGADVSEDKKLLNELKEMAEK